ncbi:MAG: DivIVA domain-containing protein [bacterium]
MITPLEIREKRFKTGWPGFSKKEVIDFLDLLSIEFQEVLKENREVRQQLDEERGKKEKLIEREGMIKEVLMIAQSSSEKVRENAIRESELMIKEAELKAEKILGEANQKKDQILCQIQDLKSLYQQFRAKVQSTLEMYGKLLAEDDEFKEKKGEGEPDISPF